MDPEQIRARIRELLAQRATHEQALTAALATLRGDNVADTARADATTAASAARAAIVPVDEQLDEQQAALRAALDQQTRDANAAALRAELGGGGQQGRQGGAHVGQEPRTYSAERDRRGEASFFVDAFRAQMMGDVTSRQRLERHMQEVIVEREAPARQGDPQTRAVSTGSFGGLIVPQYLIGLAARVMRAGRPIANVVARLPLPEQGMTLSIPRGTTGAAVSSQATENSALQNTDEVWTDLLVPVATIGGQQDVSRQSLERGTPGIDQIVYMDLAGAYHAELDRQVIRGSGASGQLTGLQNTAGTAQSTAFGGALTGAALNTKVAGGVAAISGVGIGVTPKVIAMHPRRWGYLISLSDTAGRPLVVPNAGAGSNVLAANTDPGGYSGGDDPGNFRQATPVGSMQGLPVITDANLPTNQGTNLEDVIVVLDNDQVLLWEDGDGMPRQLRFEQTLGQNLTVKLVVYSYAAFTAGRYPQAVAKIGGVDTAAGNGLIAPTF
jgi:HK97 family phage major capsid protein